MTIVPSTAPIPPSRVSPDVFKEGMARVAGTVHIITTQSATGPVGFTATAVTSVSADPPTLLVCVNETSTAGPHFTTAQSLAVNTITAGHNDVAMLFGGKTPMQDRFAAATWTAGHDGAPILKDALVSFDCRVTDVHASGTHLILICEVAEINLSTLLADPSVYLGRSFRSLAPLPNTDA